LSSTIWAYGSRSSRRRRSPGPSCRRCWRSQSHSNVAIKITGACTLSHEPFPYKDIWDPLAHIFDAFTFDRCMWGTDWTRAVKLLTYKEGVEAFRVTDRLSDGDRAKLMGGTLSRIYGWSPSKA
jgi:L-fuconolactonase